MMRKKNKEILYTHVQEHVVFIHKMGEELRERFYSTQKEKFSSHVGPTSLYLWWLLLSLRQRRKNGYFQRRDFVTSKQIDRCSSWETRLQISRRRSAVMPFRNNHPLSLCSLDFQEKHRTHYVKNTSFFLYLKSCLENN